MASLPSILILGADAAAAASPATPVQLIHGCRQLGFAAVVPASWGDELIATDVIRRCTNRDARPVVQCSCPRVADRLGSHAAALEDSIFWLVPPPVAVAKYLRAIESPRVIHLTYAGACPGGTDGSIDQRVTPTELLTAIASAGIVLGDQPLVFEDIVPADRRRHASSPGGTPEHHRLWDLARFRIARAPEGEIGVGVGQLLLSEERVLIDLAATLGCVCRLDDTPATASPVTLVRSPSPVVVDGKIDVSRPMPNGWSNKRTTSASTTAAVGMVGTTAPTAGPPALPR